MESRNPLRHLLAIIVTLVPFIYFAMVWQDVPDIVATHFDIHGKPDSYGNKSEILFLSIFVAVVTLTTYMLVINAHKLDKKRKPEPGRLDNVAMGLVVFMAIINITVIVNSIHPEVPLLQSVIIPATGLFFVFLGNVMYNIKPNRFVGIRVYWTLNDEDTWKATHRMGSKLFFVGGILITLVSIGSPVEVAMITMTGIVIIITLVTTIYSYLYHKKTRKKNA